MAVLWPKGGGHPIGANIPTCYFPSAKVLLRRPSVWLWPKGISPSTIRCCPSSKPNRHGREGLISRQAGAATSGDDHLSFPRLLGLHGLSARTPPDRTEEQTSGIQS